MDLSRRHDYFEALHANTDDPWHVDSSWYEERKARLVMAVLPKRNYTRGCEPGSSIGSLTERIAARCDEVVATDVSSSALARLRDRMPHQARVTAELISLPTMPAGTYDLIVLSEVLNYLSVAALSELLAHRTRDVPGQPITSETAHEAFIAVEGLELRTEIRDRHFRISCLRWHPREASEDDPLK